MYTGVTDIDECIMGGVIFSICKSLDLKGYQWGNATISTAVLG
jgi:hypothetical protein